MVEEEEKIFTIPLRVSRRVPRSQRTSRALEAIKEHVMRQMKARNEDVWIDPRVNEVLWKRGIQRPPNKIRVKVIKFEDELVEVSLPEE